MRFSTFASVLSLSSMLFASNVSADLVKDGDNASVTATVLGPAGLVVKAKNSDVVVDDDGPELKVIVTSSSFKTGLDLRDKHLSKAIDAKKYPTIVITMLDSDVKIPVSEDVEKGLMSANLTFHGITKPIKIEYEAAKDCDGHIGVNADFDVDVRDHGITPPSYLGVGVKPNVHMHTWIRLIDIDGC